MNKTITIYELLGLIKEGKAPQKIKYGSHNWEYDKNYNDYRDEAKDFVFGCSDYDITAMLSKAVEILDEENEFIEIEELLQSDVITVYIISDKINQLIHNQKILIDKMKEKKDE